MKPEMEFHAERQTASRAAARYLRRALESQLREHRETTLVVSGGSTPAECLQSLAGADLPWRRIHVRLTDERCVPVTDAASNERMVREHLLIGAAARASFVPLAPGGLSPAQLPFGAVLAGMGDDGHVASLFPDAPGLEGALELAAAPACVSITTAASPFPRVSLNLSALVSARLVVLLVFGRAKRGVLEAPEGLPVDRLLSQQRAPVRVVWAP